MMGRREKLKCWDEWDWCSEWRFHLVYTHAHSGVGRRVKRRLNKRARKEAKLQIGACGQGEDLPVAA
jgi:hypothetical protein